MIKLYEYLYYRIWCWNREGWPQDESTPKINAFVVMVVATSWNVLTLMVIVECSIGVALLPKLPKWQIALAAVAFGLPHYFLLLHRGAADRIIKAIQKRIA